jgi:hypothetical protein
MWVISQLPYPLHSTGVGDTNAIQCLVKPGHSGKKKNAFYAGNQILLFS